MLTTNELREINGLLKHLNSKNSNFSIYVDNLHYPYVLLPEEYILPPISNMELSKQDILLYLEILSKFIPEAMVGCSVLPIQKPKRESGKISLVKEISIHGYDYLYILKIEAGYLGGSNKAKIKLVASQFTHPAFETDRIYFSTRILPIKNVVRKDGEIVDFDVQTFDKGLFFSEVESELDDRPRKYSELFDEIDYSGIVESVKMGLKIVHPNWALGKIYEPVYIEYLTLVIRFMYPSFEKIFSHFSHFYEVLEVLHSGKTISEISIRNFIYWLKLHTFERSVSPSGNMRWKINF